MPESISMNKLIFSAGKSQLISKGLFGILNSSKNERKYDTTGRLVFVRFSEEFEDSKKAFRN